MRCGGDLSVLLRLFISFITSNQLVVQVAYLASTTSPHARFLRRLKIRMSIITIVLIFPVPVPPQGILAKRKYSQHIFAPHRLKKNRILSYALILVTSRMPVKDLGRCQMTESLKHSLNSGL